MTKNDKYHNVDSYTEAFKSFEILVGMLLFEFARHDSNNRDVIIRNYLARTNIMIKAIFQLWDINDYQDCWILHRCLIDRLFHLHHLDSKDEFDIYEEWSFFEQYKALNRLNSDPQFKDREEVIKMSNQIEKNKERIKDLIQNPPKWQRPKAEEVAKQLNLKFIYKYGYDFASAHVHPMANDGQRDFFNITKLETLQDFPDEQSVLNNTLLMGIMIIQTGLTASTLSWHKLVNETVENMVEFLNSGSDFYQINIYELGMLFGKNEILSQKKTDELS